MSSEVHHELETIEERSTFEHALMKTACVLSTAEQIANIGSWEFGVDAETLQLERAVNELDAFSYTVSHDLHAPLRGVEGFSKALSKEYREQLPEPARKYLDRIGNGVQRMSMLIDDIMAVSHAGRRQQNIANVEMGDLVRGVLSELQS